MSRNGYLAQLIFYGFVGLIGTVFHYTILLVSVEIFSVSVVVSSGVGFLVGATINHELNRRFVFKETELPYAKTAGRFFAVAGFGLILNIVTIYFLVSAIGIHYFAAQILATAFVFLTSFVANKAWTFLY